MFDIFSPQVDYYQVSVKSGSDILQCQVRFAFLPLCHTQKGDMHLMVAFYSILAAVVNRRC